MILCFANLFKCTKGNPCNEGIPVLAQNPNRECLIQSNMNEAINSYNLYQGSDKYDNVNMKYIFKTPKCANDIINSSNYSFPTDFTIELCENYMTDYANFFRRCW